MGLPSLQNIKRKKSNVVHSCYCFDRTVFDRLPAIKPWRERFILKENFDEKVQ